MTVGAEPNGGRDDRYAQELRDPPSRAPPEPFAKWSRLDEAGHDPTASGFDSFLYSLRAALPPPPPSQEAERHPLPTGRARALAMVVLFDSVRTLLTAIRAHWDDELWALHVYLGLDDWRAGFRRVLDWGWMQRNRGNLGQSAPKEVNEPTWMTLNP